MQRSVCGHPLDSSDSHQESAGPGWSVQGGQADGDVPAQRRDLAPVRIAPAGPGAGLCHEVVVDLCVREGPSRIALLREIGVKFTGASSPETDADLDLAREGGHSARRVAHAADMTGREVERALLEAVGADPRVRILEEHMAIDLITLAKYGGPEICAGAYVLDVGAGRVETVLARATVLATGGAG